MTTRILVGSAALAAWLLAACGPTNRDVIEEFAARYLEKRDLLAGIARSLPPAGGVRAGATRAGLDPAPVFREDGGGNTEIVMAAHLEDPAADLSGDDQLDLLLHGPLLEGVRYAGPGNPLSGTALDAGAPDDLRADLERGLGTRYLAAVRVLETRSPRSVDEERFVHGSVSLEVFLVDLESREVLIGLPVSARTSDRVEFRYEEGGDRRAAFERWAHSDLWENARKAVVDALAAATGGTFTLRD